VRQRFFAQVVEQFRRAVDHVLHGRVLGVEDAQRVAVQAALGFRVQQRFVAFQVSNQVHAVARALFGVADRIEFEADVFQAQVVPQAAAQHDHLGIDVGTGEAHGFAAELVELAIAAALRTLVAEHRSRVPHALRTFVHQVVFDDSAHRAGRAFRTQGQLVAVHRIGERIHLFFNDVGDGADGALEQRRVFHDRRADLLEAVALHHRLRGVLEQLPQVRVLRQDVVHAFDGGDFFSFFIFGHGSDFVKN